MAAILLFLQVQREQRAWQHKKGRRSGLQHRRILLSGLGEMNQIVANMVLTGGYISSDKYA